MTFALLFSLAVWTSQNALHLEITKGCHVNLLIFKIDFLSFFFKFSCFQVSWIWEPIDGQRDNIAVFHPMYGQSFPNLSFKDRVVFLHNNLENPSIRISNLTMSDAGRYTCEYATYPSGNEQGTTTLIMLGELMLCNQIKRNIYNFWAILIILLAKSV